ncbi:DUF4145 domain-containing protein [Rhizobium sp. CB3171]|uniref:DUF4145 domain-containing protein n=1 Tax=Rhizobium sp. CB3171 TaxID=3039157 RepID=UPI0024B21595|nr:DUF4145 domain-containing protein [Rhizobium sp. CB3171]WFU03274.1 DUF4145 domain-containing protein [Rhizobium sp. CB3171]
MKCPHCGVEFHDQWTVAQINWGRFYTHRRVQATRCPSEECGKYIVSFGIIDSDDGSEEWRIIDPTTATRGPVPKEVPGTIANDYIEACNVLPISPKASAALSRRCLQAMLRAHGYMAKDLAKEIDLLLNETDTTKAIPSSLRTMIDAIRNFGNFSAHPITDVTTLQIIDVEPEEAEWCLEVLEECFEHFYVRPAQAAARKAVLDAKLAQAGKPASKG